jgi:hypothetical protein
VTAAGCRADRADAAELESDRNREWGVDFVVAGFGLGAVLMLVGFAVRDVGPLRNRSRQDDDVSVWQWTELFRIVGTMIVSGGFAVCLVTLLLLAAGVSDATGALLVAVVAAAAVIGSGVGSVLMIRRFAEERATWSFRPAARSGRRLAEVELAPAEVTEPHETPEQLPAAEVVEDRAERVVGPVLEEVRRESSPGPVFASSILADVGTAATSENGSGFRSRVLADVAATAGEGSGSGYTSSVLADLAGDVYGPPVPDEPASVEAVDAVSDDGEKRDPKPGASAEGEPRPGAGEPAATSDDEATKDKEADVVGAPRVTP